MNELFEQNYPRLKERYPQLVDALGSAVETTRAGVLEDVEPQSEKDEMMMLDILEMNRGKR